MKISTLLSYSGNFKETIDTGVVLEAAGVDMVWVAEAYGFDAVSALGYLAARTTTLELASGILPVYSRTPALIAQTAAGLDALSEGRFVLGLGASGPQVIEGWHGLPYVQPLARTREVVDVCRMAWRRERLEYRGKTITLPLPPEQGTGLGKPLKMINRPFRERIPVYIASLGPKNVQLTAELAEGWLPLFFHPEKSREVWKGDLEAGQAARDPALGPLEVVAGGMVAIGDDAAKVRDFARPMVALYVGGMGAKGRNFYNDLFTRYGYEAEAAEIQDLYLSGRKDEAAALVPDEFLEATSLCGPAGYVREQLARYREAGVTNLLVTPVGPDPMALIRHVRELLDQT